MLFQWFINILYAPNFAGQLIPTYLAIAVAVNYYQRHAEAHTTGDYTVYHGVPRCRLGLSYYQKSYRLRLYYYQKDRAELQAVWRAVSPRVDEARKAEIVTALSTPGEPPIDFFRV